MRRWYVYALIDPRTGEPFYIGKGRGRRMYQHAAAARRGDDIGHPKVERIRAITAAGLKVEHRALQWFDDERAAYAEERRLIAATSGLTNIAGGGGAPSGMVARLERELAYVRALLVRVKPFDEWMAEAPRSPEIVALYQRIVRELLAMFDSLRDAARRPDSALARMLVTRQAPQRCPS
jgi:hypothetical protein